MSTGPAGIGPTEISGRSFTTDRIGAGDATLSPDGILDAAFDVEVNGPVVALIVRNVDGDGNALYDQVWDTLVADEPFPTELGTHFSTGGQTAVLGVEEDGVVLNRADGSLMPLGPGPHALTLFASPVEFVPIVGYQYRVTAVLADGGLVSGPVVFHP